MKISNINNRINDTDSPKNNPLLKDFATNFGVPPFDLIKDEHFIPAISKGIEEHKSEIDLITNNSETPNFINTIEALDKSGHLLTTIVSIFYNLTSANTNDFLEKVSEDTAPELSNHADYISLNEKLFVRVKSVWDAKNELNLNEEQAQLLDKTYKSFVRNGALLSKEDKEKIIIINSELALLSIKFGQNNLAEINEFKLILDKIEDLKGLPADLIASAYESANKEGLIGKWLFTLQNSSIMPFLQYAENRNLRATIWTAMKNKGNNGNENDNNEIIKSIIKLRLQRANLLGYETHAHYVLEEQMAKTPSNVYKLLNDLWGPALNKAIFEAQEIQEFINSEGGNFELQPYDWRYYAEKLRKQKFDLDENDLKPYFSLENVHKGIFGVVEKLFGLKFKESKDLPTYHEEATAYQVLEADDTFVGTLYMDFHPRSSKRGGAWMTSYSNQKKIAGKRIAPVISIVCNFSRPSSDLPALLTFDEVNTYFHEFGHALHGLLSNVDYSTLAGTNVPTDFVELPSQIMENWASEPEVLKMFAKHHQTGEIIPDRLIQKLKSIGTYGQGFALTEYLAASLLDMDFHTIKENYEGTIDDFEQHSIQSKGLLTSIIPRYKSTYFNHIFGGGYSAGYYSYIWSEVLDSDAFEAFKQNGLFDPKTALSFRKNILEKGGSGVPMDLYKRFRGADPQIKPLLLKRGLTLNE